METFILNKQCERCKTAIPDSYGNLLCITCYQAIEKGVEASKMPQVETLVVSDPHYHENEEADDIDMVGRLQTRFKTMGQVMPVEQRTLYTAIKNWLREECVTKNIQFPKFIWKPTVCDIGCGLGIGANIISQEADYVLGIDKSEESVTYATQMFMREKNNIYWSPQIDFMTIDVTSDTRELMKFDFVTCIEVFEHLKDYQKLLEFCKKLMKPNTVLFISTPNRNSDKIAKDKPRNPHHVRELTSQEFVSVLSGYFSSVELRDYSLNRVENTTDITPIVAMCKV